MAKQPLAIVTMCYNEPDFLPIWLDYYGTQVPLEHLYIVDHGSNDGSTEHLARVNVVRVPRSPLDEGQRAQFIAGFCNSLLQWFDHVAYTDIDEMLVADPREHANLVNFCMSSKNDITTALGMHVAHHIPDEPDLIPNIPILQQRRTALAVGSMCKPTIVRRPVIWGPGFHYADAETTFSSLFLFHLAYFNHSTARRRQAKRMGVTRTTENGFHHSTPVEEFMSHVESWSRLPIIETTDLGQDCPVRMTFVQTLFATRRAGNSLQQIDATVAEGSLWRIPRRFASVF